MSEYVGDLIWKLKADVTQLEKALDGAEKSLEKTSKKGGGILDILGSKWVMMAGMATGAAYAMIRSSPSLSFAMEEMQYRFEEIFMILGEEFAPLIEEIIIPALDAFIPIVKEIAPVIGEAVEAIIGYFKGEEMSAFLDKIVPALERIASAIWDIAEPAIRAVWDLFQEISPYIMDVLVIALEGLAWILEQVANAFGKEYGVYWYINKVVDALNAYLVPAIEWVIEKLGTLKEWGDKVIQVFEDILDLLPSFPSVEEFAGTPMVTTAGGLPVVVMGGFQEGGIVPRTGPYLLHAGETVVPASQTFQTTHVSVEVHIGPVSLGSEMDIRTLTERISQELKRELERSVF